MAEILEFAIFVTYRPDPAHLFPSVHFDEYETHYPTRDTTVFHRWRMTSTFTLPCFIRGSRPTSPYLSLPAKIIVFARVRADPPPQENTLKSSERKIVIIIIILFVPSLFTIIPGNSCFIQFRRCTVEWKVYGSVAFFLDLMLSVNMLSVRD